MYIKLILSNLNERRKAAKTELIKMQHKKAAYGSAAFPCSLSYLFRVKRSQTSVEAKFTDVVTALL